MLGRLLYIFSSMHVAFELLTLLNQTSRRLLKKKPKISQRNYIEGEDKISALSNDLLVRILSLVPTKDAVTTMILSKRWQFIWTMVPKLEYKDINNDHEIVVGGLLGSLVDHFFAKNDQQGQSFLRFIDESLIRHKAPVLERLVIELGPQFPVDVDVGRWVTHAVNHKVRELGFTLTWSAEPISLPKSLYRCDTLVSLGLFNKILIDVPSFARLPSLKCLGLYSVAYKDEDSLVRLLSSCPILKNLGVVRHYKDNVTNFNIKVPSLECLLYDYEELGERNEGIGGSLVIDSPSLKKIFIIDCSGDSCSIENKPSFDKAIIDVVCYPDNTFMRSLSSLMYLELTLNVSTIAWCNTINFPQLIECKIALIHELDWLEPIMLLLKNSPNLKVLLINQVSMKEDFSLSWNQPSSVPECFLTHLEIFEWKGYGGRSEEKEVVRYIFANSMCLKRAGISMSSACKFKEKKMMKELESITRVSTSSQLLFSTQLKYLIIQNEMAD